MVLYMLFPYGEPSKPAFPHKLTSRFKIVEGILIFMDII
jgi:hypothetical protein